jgi:signal recognition particle subunit SEC65
MEILTIRPQNNEQLEAIKSVLKVLKIPFQKEEDLYNPEFVKKIQKAEKEKEGIISLETDEDIDEYFETLETDVQG